MQCSLADFIKMRGKTSELHSGDDSAYLILPL